MTDYATAILQEAKSWLECKETSKNRSVCVDKIHKEFSENWNGSPDAWCAKYVWVVVDRASKLYAVSNPLPHTAGALDLLNKCKAAGIYVDKTPAPGSIFYKKSTEGTGHVGFVAQVVGNKIYTFEGNSNDRVLSSERAITSDFQFIHVETKRKIYFKNSTYFLSAVVIAGGGYLAWKKFIKK